MILKSNIIVSTIYRSIFSDNPYSFYQFKMDNLVEAICFLLKNIDKENFEENMHIINLWKTV